MFENDKINFNKLLERNQKEYLHIGISGLTNEIQNDYMVLVAARPAIGKTALLTKIAYGACINKNKVAFFSSDKPKYSLYKNMISRALGCSIYDLKDYDLNHEISKYENKFDDLYLFDHKFNLNDLYNKIVDLDDEINGLDLVIIDSIDDLVNGEYTYEDVCSLLKKLAYELKIHFIVSTKLAKTLERREDKHPKMTDLLFNPKIYFEKVIMLYRDSYYEKSLYNGEELNLELHLFSHFKKYAYERYGEIKLRIF
jgi:replicative DNA helicase